jgi:hypothetical protein
MSEILEFTNETIPPIIKDTPKNEPFSIEEITGKDEVVIYVRIIDESLLNIVKKFVRNERLYSIKPKVIK